MKDSTRRVIKILLNLVWFSVMVLFFIFLFPRILEFFTPFIVGWIIAWLANPLFQFLERKLKIKRKAGTVIVAIIAISAVCFLCYGVIALLLEQVTGFIESIPDLAKSLGQDFQQIGRNLSVIIEGLPWNMQLQIDDIYGNITAWGTEFMSQYSAPTVEAVGDFAKNIPSTMISLIMGALAAYFFVVDRDYLSLAIQRHVPEKLKKRSASVSNNLKFAVGGYIKAQLKIEVVMYFILLIGLSVLNIPYAILIAFGMALLDILPFLGTAIVLIPWAAVKLLSGDYTMAIGLLIIWGVGQLIRQVIQPKIMGDSIGMPPIPTLFLLFIGYKTYGVLGMILALPMGIILVKMNEEGVFDTAKNSLSMGIKLFNDARRLDKKDLEYLKQSQDEE